MKLSKHITKLFAFKALAFLFIPLILFLVTSEWRSSISDYYYSNARDAFVALLVLAGGLFIDSGIAKQKWYNIILGISLIIVAFTPHLNFPILHYGSAGIFFLGSCFVMVYYSNKKQRFLMWVLASLVIIALALNFVLNLFSLLVAEWVGMLPITFHFIGEILNKIE